MYKPSYISGYKFGTGMKHSIKLHTTVRQIYFKWNASHLNAFAQILEGTFLATTSQRSYCIKHYKKHIEFE